MVSSSPADPSDSSFTPSGLPTRILSSSQLAVLNARANSQGFRQFAGHLTVLVASGAIWATQGDRPGLALPALMVYGFSLAAMFAPMHECGHRTAFANPRINDAVAWIAGVLSFYNSTFYRAYHKWHHRYTQIPGKDPELEDAKPTTWAQYWAELSGWNWWLGKIRTHTRVAMGHLDDFPYISVAARAETIRSTRLQLLVYGAAIALSIGFRQPWFLQYWLIPLAVGQPILRTILLAEHTGCTNDNNYLSNTRTTLTFAPLRWLMWNMPFHAEHHLYPSIPFHALPTAHTQLRPHFAQVAPGYGAVHRQIQMGFKPVTPVSTP